MTFTEIQTEILDRLNLTSADASTRIGRAINRYYQHVTSTCGLNTTRQIVGASEVVSIGDPSIEFDGIEKITKVYKVIDGKSKAIKEVAFLQLRDMESRTTDDIRFWAHQTGTGTSVTIRVDANPVTGYTIYADGYSTLATLSGSDVPVLPVSFHDILIWGPLVDEYQKMEKVDLARDCKAELEKRLSDFRLFLAKNAYQDNFQGAASPLQRQTPGGGGAGGGGSNDDLFVKLAGRGGGQEINGGTAASEDLTLVSTAHATKGTIRLEDPTVVDESLTVSSELYLDSGHLEFPGTQVPSADVHVLDDYEEGTWTPAWAGSGGQSGQVYSAQQGTYIKVGKKVFVSGRIVLSTLGTITGDLKLTGLPFTAANLFCPGTVQIGLWGGMTSSLVYISGIVDTSAITCTMLGATAAATGLSNLSQSTLSATSDVFFSCTYEAVN